MARKTILLLGASGNVAPHITAGLERHYEVRPADVKPHPEGRPLVSCDITSYEQVREAARGTQAILNFTVNRSHPTLSFGVNLVGAYHVMRAAVELGIPTVVHTGPQMTMSEYAHDFDLANPPPRPGTGYYTLTKHLSNEVCESFARGHGVRVLCFLFNGLHAKPTAPIQGQDFPPFTVNWEDLVEACRLAIEVESVPGNYQSFEMHSHLGHHKHLLDHAERILGFRPHAPVEQLYRRPV
ncbi:MAG: NAD(P)-dependent oxidoreductase [Candidatus Latescibacterota bacterium]